MGVEAEEFFWLGGQEQVAVVGIFFGDGVGQLAREVVITVEEGDEGTAGVLPGEVCEDDGFDVWVGFKTVDEADTCVVDHYDGVGALVGDIVYEGIREVVVNSWPIEVFLCPGVNEDEACIGIVVNG